MKVYVIIKEGKVDSFCYTSLSEACSQWELSYDSALRGKRKWIVGGLFIEIKEMEVVKIVGRGKGIGKSENFL